MLKKMLKGNVVAIGKNYNELSGDEIKALMYLQTLSNSNNVVVATNLNVLSMFSGIDKRYLSNYIEKLAEKEKISIDGDIKKYCHITINIDDNFEKFNVEFILDMLKDLNGSELKLYCTMTKHLNLKNNKNYIYPSMATLVEGYYSANELKDVELDDKLKEKYLNKLKNKLIEKGYIKMIAAYYFETKSGDKGKSSLGYFLKTDINEVADDEYYSFVKNEINKYNENHNNMMKLATEEYLKKCKYKNLDKYIYYKYQENDTVKEENSKQVQAVEEVEPVVETEEVITEETVECIQQDETIKEEVYEVDLYKKYTTDQTDYKLNFEMLLDSKYPHFKVKKLNEYINEFGYKTMYKVFKHDLEDIFENINGDNLRHRVNILLADKFGKFRNEIEYREIAIREEEREEEKEKFILKLYYDEYSSECEVYDTRSMFKELLNKYKFLNCKKFDEILEKCKSFKDLISCVDFLITENDDINSLIEKVEKYIDEINNTSM